MRILLADDSITMRKIVSNILNSLGYSDIIEADCGEDVLARLDDNPDIDLIMLDWNMPLTNGLDCLKAIRANPATKAKPVIMVTSEATPERIKEAIRCGVNNYLVKPFDAERLANAINTVMGEKTEAKP